MMDFKIFRFEGPKKAGLGPLLDEFLNCSTIASRKLRNNGKASKEEQELVVLYHNDEM